MIVWGRNERWSLHLFLPICLGRHFADSVLWARLSRPNSYLPFNFIKSFGNFRYFPNFAEKFLFLVIQQYLPSTLTEQWSWTLQKENVTTIIPTFLPGQVFFLWGIHRLQERRHAPCLEKRKHSWFLGEILTPKGPWIIALKQQFPKCGLGTPGLPVSLGSNDLHINAKTLFASFTLILSQVYNGVPRGCTTLPQTECRHRSENSAVFS